MLARNVRCKIEYKSRKNKIPTSVVCVRARACVFFCFRDSARDPRPSQSAINSLLILHEQTCVISHISPLRKYTPLNLTFQRPAVITPCGVGPTEFRPDLVAINAVGICMPFRINISRSRVFRRAPMIRRSIQKIDRNRFQNAHGITYDIGFEWYALQSAPATST